MRKSALPGIPQPGDGAGAAAASAGGNAPAATGAAKPDNSTPADPKALIANASKNAKDASTYKFEWKLGDKAGTAAFQTSGEVDTKNQALKGDSSMGAPGGGGPSVKISIIAVNKTFYMKAGDAPKWTKFTADDMTKALGSLGGGGGDTSSGKPNSPQPGSDPLAFFDQIKDFATTTPDGTDTVRGAPATRYNVVIDPSKVNVIGGDPTDAKSTVVKVWIDGQGRLVKFTINAPDVDSASGAGAGEMDAEFFDYGSAVNIQAPPDSEVQSG